MSVMPQTEFSSPFRQYGVQSSATSGRRKRVLDIPPAPFGVGAAQSYQVQRPDAIPAPPPMGDYRNMEKFEGQWVPRVAANNTRAQRSLDQDRALTATSNADFVESAPMPQTQEGYARRRAYLNRQRGKAADLEPAPANVLVTNRGVVPIPVGSQVVGAGGAMAQRAAPPMSQGEAEAHLGTSKTPGMSVDELTEARRKMGVLPGGDASAPVAQAPAGPYDSPTPPAGANGQPLPSENDPAYVAQQHAQAESDRERMSKFPITMQQAKAMYDALVASGQGLQPNPDTNDPNAGQYHPDNVFHEMMGKYGIPPAYAQHMLDFFKDRNANPNFEDLTEAQRSAVSQSKNPLFALRAANPYASGAVLPGNTPIDKAKAQDYSAVDPRSASAPGNPGASAGKPITPELVERYKRLANGDANQARQMAIRDGYDTNLR